MGDTISIGAEEIRKLIIGTDALLSGEAVMPEEGSILVGRVWMDNLRLGLQQLQRDEESRSKLSLILTSVVPLDEKGDTLISLAEELVRMYQKAKRKAKGEKAKRKELQREFAKLLAAYGRQAETLRVYEDEARGNLIRNVQGYRGKADTLRAELEEVERISEGRIEVVRKQAEELETLRAEVERLKAPRPFVGRPHDWNKIPVDGTAKPFKSEESAPELTPEEIQSFLDVHGSQALGAQCSSDDQPGSKV